MATPPGAGIAHGAAQAGAAQDGAASRIGRAGSPGTGAVAEEKRRIAAPMGYSLPDFCRPPSMPILLPLVALVGMQGRQPVDDTVYCNDCVVPTLVSLRTCYWLTMGPPISLSSALPAFCLDFGAY